MLIDVLFLRVVQAHEGLDRLDHTLGVAKEIPVGILRLQPGPPISIVGGQDGEFRDGRDSWR